MMVQKENREKPDRLENVAIKDREEIKVETVNKDHKVQTVLKDLKEILEKTERKESKDPREIEVRQVRLQYHPKTRKSAKTPISSISTV